ncbi:MAG: hypothetical protein J0M04_05435 [Verrucomicrobia bacterium]|jgi:hypothetical protein|nr:hypothetical protein [Verrucomicrobiota bacterium]
MLTINPLLKAVALLLLAAVAGCVNEPAHRSWPKPVQAATLSQFAGVYRNKSYDYKTGKPSDFGSGFYHFLTGGRDDDLEYDGDRLAIRFSPDGELMHLRLLDVRGKVIQSADLRRGVQFDFINGMIVRKMGSQGFCGGIDGAFIGVSHNRYELRTSATGGILGHENSTGGMLVAFIVPVGGSENIWSYWPRLGETTFQSVDGRSPHFRVGVLPAQRPVVVPPPIPTSR